MEETEDTAPQPGGFRRILLCLDSHEASGCACAFVRRLARPDSEITIAAVAPDPHLIATHAALTNVDVYRAQRELLEEAERAIEKASSALAKRSVAVRTHVFDLVKDGGDVARALTRRAQEDSTDLMIVVVRQHHGLVRWFDSSVVDALSRLSPCAMVVVPAGYEDAPDAGFQRILFAIDGSPTSFAALRTGVMLATPATQIRVVYVVNRAICDGSATCMAHLQDAFVKEGERAIAAADGQLQTLQDVMHLQVSADLISTDTAGDDISSALLRDAESWNADLLVMGTHGRRGGPRSYLGSVPNQVASLAKIRLMLVRERHGEPVTDAV
ncbi:UspA domain-containing protein [Caballeronia terrestris]|uniref:UspA domain-containing protein n=1 Tax=Caballeronia terrestris TaxID=1226301 RepID=A0A158KFW2_9BURK|nr:universal stress protein [Caballeronia terrestris]SAL80012.1 UspA domain-containing protein [Caballeronia terrestris]